MQTKIRLIILYTFLYFCFNACVYAQNRISHDLITITYNHQQNISANSFFQNKMMVEKDYKVAGRKFEIFLKKIIMFSVVRDCQVVETLRSILYILLQRIVLF